MTPGISQTIEYIWTDDKKRIASLETIDEAGSYPFPQTYDPRWIVTELESGNEARFKWLNYITHDGSLWQARTYASTMPGDWVFVGFEHVPYPDGDGHPESYINFFDWERQPWSARVLDVTEPFPAQPRFDIRRGLRLLVHNDKLSKISITLNFRRD